MPKTVHVVFKTHLDVGFTDLAARVVHRYLGQYIPAAIRLARDLREGDTEARFVWTTGAWLIHTCLEQATPRLRRELERAIAAGDIRWHALPFTTHSEAMDAGLFRCGLGLAAELDRRFGLQTRAAKMTDVPGHTRGIVPLLAAAGVRFLHLGVNPASPAPAVPDVFRWRDPASDTEVVVMYHKGNYGGAMAVDGLNDAIYFAHTGDNCGPQSREDIVRLFADLRARFPGDRVVASTMEPMAAALWAHRERLPVVSDELGDTWIHGLGTDPRKLAGFRELCRLRSQWEATVPASGPRAAALRRFGRALLPVAEHTWGLDTKGWLGDYVNWSRRRFETARRRDVVDARNPTALAFCTRYAHAGTRRYRTLEQSWTEQRRYLTEAVRTLAGTPWQRAARTALAHLAPRRPALRGFAPLAPGVAVHTPQLSATVDPATGALTDLVSQAGRRWASPAQPLALLRYQTFAPADCARWHRDYNVNMEHRWCSDWAIPDFGKPGLRPQDSPAAWHLPRLRRLLSRTIRGETVILAELAFAESAHRRFGAPAEVWLLYRFPHDAAVVDIELEWFDKPANRMPEALWLSFVPACARPEAWTLDKLGTAVSPLAVVSRGNRNLHGVGRGAEYAGPDGRLDIETLDAPLIAPGRPRLLEFDDSLPDLRGGLHVNLYNNVWGTNFPMWFGENACFRFRLTFAPPA